VLGLFGSPGGFAARAFRGRHLGGEAKNHGVYRVAGVLGLKGASWGLLAAG
jgi:hypothetical protein